jgi:hypothetical protein
MGHLYIVRKDFIHNYLAATADEIHTVPES